MDITSSVHRFRNLPRSAQRESCRLPPAATILIFPSLAGVLAEGVQVREPLQTQRGVAATSAGAVPQVRPLGRATRSPAPPLAPAE